VKTSFTHKKKNVVCNQKHAGQLWKIKPLLVFSNKEKAINYIQPKIIWKINVVVFGAL